MDLILHAAWSYIFFAGASTKNLDLAMLFGILPDLLAFTPMVLKKIFIEKKVHPKHHFSGAGPNPNFPNYVVKIYDVTHSLIVAIPIITIAFLLMKSRPWFLLAWPLHIIIDIPTHDIEHFPTPFLWPFSRYRFNGVSWARKNAMIINYFIIIIVLLLILWIK